MSYFKTGLCSVTFRKKSAEQIVEIAKKAGISYIEWGGDVHVKSLQDAKRVKALCREGDIKISSYGSYFNSAHYSREKWTEICEIAREMSAPSIRIWLGRADSEKTDEKQYALLLENTRKMCDIASDYGLTVCPECHGNTYNNDTDAFLRFFRDLERDNFSTYFQSRYFRMEYDLDRIDRTFDCTRDVHISYRDLKREQRMRKKDKNYLDTLLRRLKEKGFEGIVMIEFVSFGREKSLYKDAEKLKSY